MFLLHPFTDDEWAERGGYPGAKSSKKRAQLGKGAFAITYRMMWRAGTEEGGVKAEQVSAPATPMPHNSRPPNPHTKDILHATALTHPQPRPCALCCAWFT